MSTNVYTKKNQILYVVIKFPLLLQNCVNSKNYFFPTPAEHNCDPALIVHLASLVTTVGVCFSDHIIEPLNAM